MQHKGHYNELIEKPTLVYFLEIDLLLKEKPILKENLRLSVNMFLTYFKATLVHILSSDTSNLL